MTEHEGAAGGGSAPTPPEFPRPVRYETKCCPTCRRDGWTQRISYALWVREELGNCASHVDKLDVPQDVERVLASPGCAITEAVKEGVEVARMLGKRVAFEFNGRIVICAADSDIDKLCRAWWRDVYGETPEQSWAKR